MSKKRVLILDDSATFRMLLRRTLAAAGFDVDVREAGDADEGLASFLAEPADLVLLDLNLPIGDGVDLVSEFRPQAQVVLVTAESSQRRLDLAQSRGADACLRKPFFPEELRRVLEPFLEVSE